MLEEFCERMRLLGEKLGVVLVQFRPGFSNEKLPLLKEFLPKLPPDIRFAVEFRHRSWYTDQTAALLQEHGIAWAATEYQQLPKRIYRTTNYLYVRFIGSHGRFPVHDREQSDVTEKLEWWRDRIQEHAGEVEDIYGFFNNDYAGFSAGTTQRFMRLLGLETKEFKPPQQGRLF
jgi:uncharacterized protein YecE (DUF72 family)